ncbi:LamG domain-containing protein [Methanosarcina sp. MSH10X1]|nr:LamG domain-containing protein [Methanosarcina sp. MSH10X1]
MLAFPGAAQVTDGLVTDGLVVYYNGTLSGNSLVDLSGNSNTGFATSVTQGTNQTTGASYISLNGVNSKIDISNNVKTNISSPVTIEFYGSVNNFSKYGALVSKYNGSSGWYLSCSSDSPYKARFNVVRENGITPYGYDSNVGLVAGQIYHIVATYDNNTSQIYINGVGNPADTRAWNSPAVGSDKNITIGSGYDLNSGNCSMYTFRLYNRSLSPAEVYLNNEYEKKTHEPDIPEDIVYLKKKAYGNGGLPRYMGSHAMSQSGSEVSLVDSNLSLLGSVLTPYYKDNGSAEINYTLLDSSVSGVKWKNYYAPGSSASLSFSGNNRTRQENLSLSNNSLHLSSSVTYIGDTLVTKEAVPVTGDAFQFYGDGLNTISENTVQAYTDNGEIQKDTIFIKNSPGMSPGGIPIDNEYQNRTAGTTRSNSIDLPISSPQLTPMPCPSGYLGSLSFAIHADAQDPDSLKTLMYGTNDINDAEYGTKGYIGHGLICTWAAFAASSGGGIGFEDASFKSTLDDMHEKGFEIVPHNVVGSAGEGNPTREMTGYYLPWYDGNYTSRNWIDHGLNGGNRNTGLKSLGLENSSQYYIGDLLHEHGIEYAWAYQDITLKPNTYGEISTSRTQSLGLPYDIVWTNTNFTWDDGTPMYEWTSTWAYDKTALDYFKNDTLETMIDSYGVCFWHDYTAQNDETFEGYYYTKGNPCRINETYDNLLLNMSKQKDDGRLWNPTVSQYIDYWRAACNIECRCTGQDTYTLINHNSETVPGYAMRVIGSYTMKLDGNDLGSSQYRKHGDNTIFWMDLSPGTHSLTLARV